MDHVGRHAPARLPVFTAFIGVPLPWSCSTSCSTGRTRVAAYDLKAALRAWTDAGGALVTALHDIAAFATRCDRGLLLHDVIVVKTFEADEMARGRADVLAFEQTVYDAFKAHAAGSAS